METWRKRDDPNIEAEAIRLNEDNVEVVAQLIGALLVEEIDPEHPDEMQYGLNVVTPNGVRRATLGMYVVKFGKHLFVEHVRPFEEKYEPVNRPAPPPESIGDSYIARGYGDPSAGKRF